MTLKEDLDIIMKIVKRAEERDLLKFDHHSLIMDLRNTHEKLNLRLNDLLNADDFNFSHDITGIQQNLNRQTLEMENHFLPRYTYY